MTNFEAPSASNTSRAPAVMAGLITLVLSCGMWGGAYFGLLREKWKTEHLVKVRLADRQDVLNQLSNVKKNQPAFMSQLQDLKTQIASAHEKIPIAADVASLMDEVVVRAKQADLMLMNFDEENEKMLPYAIEVPIKATLTGEYKNIVHFLKSLKVMPRLTVVKDVHLIVFSSTQDRITLAATVILAAYRSRFSES